LVRVTVGDAKFILIDKKSYDYSNLTEKTTGVVTKNYGYMTVQTVMW